MLQVLYIRFVSQEINLNVEKAWEFVDHMYGIDYGWEVDG